jgi:hypothetical protein
MIGQVANNALESIALFLPACNGKFIQALPLRGLQQSASGTTAAELNIHSQSGGNYFRPA